MLQDTLANQLLAFPPWQEMLWGEEGVRALRLFQGAVEEVASFSDLTVLFEQNHCPIVDLKLTMVLQTSHLEGEMTPAPGDRRRKTKCQWLQVCKGPWVRLQAGTDLNVKTLGRLHVLRDVQAVASTHRAHEVCKRLFIPIEPLQLSRTQHTENSHSKHLNVSKHNVNLPSIATSAKTFNSVSVNLSLPIV